MNLQTLSAHETLKEKFCPKCNIFISSNKWLKHIRNKSHFMNEDNLDVKIFLSREMIIINDVYGRIKTLLGSINNYPILCKIEDDLIDTYVDSQAKIYKKLEIDLECQSKLSKIEEIDEIPTVSGINKSMADSINEEQLISEVSDSSVSEDDDLI